MEIVVAIVDGIFVVLVGYTAWQRRGTRPCLLLGIALGFLLGMFLHALGFGVLHIEGPGGERDIGLLIGFGIMAGVMIGMPVGLGIGFFLYRLKPKS